MEGFRNFRTGDFLEIRYGRPFPNVFFKLTKDGKARSTIRAHFSALRSFYSFLVLRGILSTNVLKGVELPKIEKQLPKFFTASQIDTFLEKPAKVERQKQARSGWPSRDEAIFELFYSTGLRLSERRLPRRPLARSSSTKPSASSARARRNASAQSAVPALEAISRYRSKAGVHAGPLFINKSRRRLPHDLSGSR